MDKRRKFYLILSFLFLLTGFSYLFSSFSGMTGFIISEDLDSSTKSFTGVLFILAGFFSLYLFRKKEGQASMDFLITYGWALLAAVTIIGALIYFGVFNLANYSAPLCNINSPWSCEEFSIDASGVELVVRNEGGKDYIINKTIIDNSGGSAYSTTSCLDNNKYTSVKNGESALKEVSCSGLTSGDSFKGTVTISYSAPGQSSLQTATGVVRGKVQ